MRNDSVPRTRNDNQAHTDNHADEPEAVDEEAQPYFPGGRQVDDLVLVILASRLHFGLLLSNDRPRRLVDRFACFGDWNDHPSTWHDAHVVDGRHATVRAIWTKHDIDVRTSPRRGIVLGLALAVDHGQLGLFEREPSAPREPNV